MTFLSIQLRRWLTQEAVWRFVGFVSTIVGLLCYALSSSFDYLFGEWSLLKIFLYSIVSLLICLGNMFAKACRHSTTLRFKAHSSFVVLTVTSVYSYFADKLVNGKPDAYSLVSCAAFAIMSLSLSRQSECGFEVDLFYFFMGCLIVLLMKITLALAIVGIGFSYGLVILRSSLSYPNVGVGVQDDELALTETNAIVLYVDQLALELARTNIDATTHDLSERTSSTMQQLQYLEEGSSEMTPRLGQSQPRLRAKKPRFTVYRLTGKSARVQRKVRLLKLLVPGCRKKLLADILEEANDYISALEMQVRAMSVLADLLRATS
ncbi:uncharacterized protein LOC109811045 isoform X1 [Cajanus cajan]|uniref:uncharacterized protein LOC109811045 isoform X1 n=1 Tax=Cajanus cajan TaxID=3821 RepID=UPI0010FBB2D4|nr:uncharacterized protein LOC109811045 isoform X1 [Cajanus cajan]